MAKVTCDKEITALLGSIRTVTSFPKEASYGTASGL